MDSCGCEQAEPDVYNEDNQEDYDACLGKLVTRGSLRGAVRLQSGATYDSEDKSENVRDVEDFSNENSDIGARNAVPVSALMFSTVNSTTSKG